MNREIKFRGMAPYTGWEYGSLVTTESGDSFIIPDYVNNEDEIHSEIQSVDPKTLGQYTGLKDKNGVEIYEGDIVNYEDPVGYVYYNNQVIFNMDILLSNLEWGLDNDKGYMILDIGRYKVIGNIHENPELI